MGGYVPAHEFWDYGVHHQMSGEGTADLLQKLDSIAVVQVDADEVKTRRFQTFWKKLAQEVFPRRPDLPFRIYLGASRDPLDIAFLSQCPSLQSLEIGTAGSLANPEVLHTLPDLQHLHLGCDQQPNWDFFSHINPQLQSLSLFTVLKRAKNHDLSPLQRFQNLRTLSINGYDKNLARTLPHFTQLQTLHLRACPSLHDLNCLLPLQQLQNLVLQGCGVADFSALTRMPSIRYLQLWNMRKLEQLDAVANMQGLQWLFIENLPNLEALPALHKLPRLRRLEVSSCRQIEDFSAVEHCERLEGFISKNVKTENLDCFLPVLRNPHLQEIGIGFAKVATQNRMKALAKAHGRPDIYACMYPDFLKPFEFQEL